MLGYFFKRQDRVSPKQDQRRPVELDLNTDVTQVYDFINSNGRSQDRLNLARQNGIQRGHLGIAYHASQTAQKPLTQDELLRAFRNYLYRNSSFFPKTKDAVQEGVSIQEEAKLSSDEFEEQFVRVDNLRELSRTNAALGNLEASRNYEKQATELEDKLKETYSEVANAVATTLPVGECLTRDPRQVFTRFDVNGQSLGPDFLEEGQALAYSGSSMAVIFADLFRTTAEDEVYELGKNAAQIVLNRKLGSMYESFEEFEAANGIILDDRSEGLSDRERARIIFESARSGKPTRADITEHLGQLPKYSVLDPLLTSDQKIVSRYMALFRPKIAQKVKRDLGLADFDLFGAYEEREQVREELKGFLSSETDAGKVPEENEAFSRGIQLDRTIKKAESAFHLRMEQLKREIMDDVKELEDIADSSKLHQLLRVLESPTIEDARKSLETLRKATYSWLLDKGYFDFVGDKQANEFIVDEYETQANRFYEQEFVLGKALVEGDLGLDTLTNLTETAQRIEKIRQLKVVKRVETKVGPLVKQEVVDSAYINAANYGLAYLNAVIENEPVEFLESETGRSTIKTATDALVWYADKLKDKQTGSVLRQALTEIDERIKSKKQKVAINK